MPRFSSFFLLFELNVLAELCIERKKIYKHF